jgi:tetratricopeptide (TPR) repeat protein
LNPVTFGGLRGYSYNGLRFAITRESVQSTDSRISGGKVMPMRVIAALALVVCLPVFCLADDWLAINHVGTEAFKEKKWAEALAAFEESWPLAKTPVEQAISANDLGAVLKASGRSSDAIPWFERAVALWRAQPDTAEQLAETALALVDAYRFVGRFVPAEQTLRSLLPMNLLAEPKGAVLNMLGDLLREQSRKPEARVFLESSLAIPGISRSRQIEARLGLADIERGVGNGPAAIDQAEKVIALSRGGSVAEQARFAGAEAVALRIEGLTWVAGGDLSRAEPMLRRSLSLLEQQEPSPLYQVSATYTALAQLYREQRKYSMSEQAWLRALELQRRHSGEHHPQTALVLEGLAGLYSIQRRHTEAADLAAQAWTIMSEAFGEESIPASGALATIAYVQEGEKRPDAAAASYARALGTMRGKAAPTDRNMLGVMEHYAAVLATLHRTDEAKQIRQEAKAFRVSNGYK